MTTTLELPIIPLNSVLFPGGRLDLRIFEQRHLNMIRDCARLSSGFGVCLILQDKDATKPACPAAFGTVAKIVDFTTLADGFLGITVSGEQRFHTEHSYVKDSGLAMAVISLCPPDPAIPVPPEYALLPTILERLGDSIGNLSLTMDKRLLDNAAWVGFRLGEILPIETEEQQCLLQVDDPIERLRLLAQWLPRFQRD